MTPTIIYQTTQAYWGWTVRITSESRRLLRKVQAQLPHPPPSDDNADLPFAHPADAHFHLKEGPEGFELYLDGEKLSTHKEATSLLAALENKFQMNLATNAPDAVFVHAGVVAIEGRCLVLPARSYSGKSTLVHALVKQGATYFSDEYAVIDKDGWVHPYRRPLTIRRPPHLDRRVPAKNFPLDPKFPKGQISMILDCQYKKRSPWTPEPITLGQGVLKLLSNTVSVQLTPKRDFQFLTAAAKPKTLCLQATRGNAKPVASHLIKLLTDQPKQTPQEP